MNIFKINGFIFIICILIEAQAQNNVANQNHSINPKQNGNDILQTRINRLIEKFNNDSLFELSKNENVFLNAQLASPLTEAKKLLAHKYSQYLGRKGDAAYKLKNVSRAISYYARCVSTSEKSGDDTNLIRCLNSLASTYQMYGDNSKAREFYFRCLSYYKRMNNELETGNTVFQLGKVYYASGDLINAIECAKSAAEIFSKLKSKTGKFESLKSIAEYYFIQFDYKHANEYAEQALAVALEDYNSIRVHLSVELLKKIYQEQHENIHAVYLFKSGTFFLASENLGTGNSTLRRIDANNKILSSVNIASMIYDIVFTNDSDGYIVGGVNFIFLTHDGGKIWKIESCNPSDNGLFSINFPDNKTGYAAGMEGTILKKNSGSDSWMRLKINSHAYLTGISFINPVTGIAVGGKGYSNPGIIVRTSDGGNTWETINPHSRFLSKVSMINKYGYACGFSGAILKTSDEGLDWTFQSSGITDNLNDIVAIDSLHVLAVGWHGTLIKSSDGGNRWKQLFIDTKNNLNAIRFSDNKVGILIGDGGTVYKTSDGGNNWINANPDLENIHNLDSIESNLLIRDSIRLETIRKAAVEQQLKFDFEKKESALKMEQERKEVESDRQKFMMKVIASGSSIILLAGVVIFILYKRRRDSVIQQKMTRLRLLAINAQMNPHFIFNCMNSIQGFIIKKEYSNADTTLVRFAQLIRKVLDNSSQKEIPLTEELDTLRNYVELEKLRMVIPFEFNIEIPESINPDIILVPPLLIQPFVENAIIHGVKPLKEKGQIRISISCTADQLKIIIFDNGIGRKNILQKNSERRSYGIPLSKERLDYLNYGSHVKVGYTIEDLLDSDHPCGTRVTLLIPLFRTV